jgi:hypothetical protein
MKQTLPTRSQARKSIHKRRDAPPSALASSDRSQAEAQADAAFVRPNWARYIDSRLKQFCTR